MDDDGASQATTSFAIVGAAIRCPGADTLEQFWKVITEGRHAVGPVPSDRFSSPSGDRLLGCFLENVDHFDARFFNISPREAAQIDPAQRLILLAGFEALQSAGITRQRLASQRRRVGTFFGITGDDYREAHAANNIDFAYVTGGTRAFGPGRLSYLFKFDGPSYAVDTACSASSACVQLAISSIIAGDCDTAVVGGANILAANEMYSGLHKGGFLSPTGGCKTFLEDADGYCRGEAVACIIIKRLQHAMADNDNILATIAACRTTHSFQSASIVQPHVGSQEALFRETLKAAALHPVDIGYVEMHGTGTQLGDAAESSSVSRVFLGPERPANRPLHVGSVKPNIGHGESASGVCSLIKAILILRHDMIPAFSLEGKKVNPKLPLKFRDTIPDSHRAFGGSQRNILVNNFGASGSNTAIVLKGFESAVIRSSDPRSDHVLTVSGKDLNAFKSNLINLIDFVEGSDALRIQDIAYTATARREQYRYRRAVVCSSSDEALSALRMLVEQPLQKPATNPKPIVFAFQGQGDDILGKGQELFRISPVFRDSILESSKLCDSLGLPSWLDLLVGPCVDLAGADTTLAQVAFQLALCDLLDSWNVRPEVVVGHSLGEYTAACIAGVLSRSDVFRVLGKRAGLLRTSCTRYSHEMLVIHADTERCKSLFSQHSIQDVEIACHNGANTVIAGSKEAIHAARSALNALSVRTKNLKVPFAFHSCQMDSIADELLKACRSVDFHPVKITLASTVTAELVRPGEVLGPDYFKQQVRQSVRFHEAVQAIAKKYTDEAGCLWLGIGPTSGISAMLKPILHIDTHTNLSAIVYGQSHWKSLASAIATLYEQGNEIDWTKYHQDYEQHLSLIQLPSYALDLKPFWLPARPWPYETAERSGEISAIIPSPLLESTLSGNIKDPKLVALIKGHAVHGSAICSTSVFADMAFSVLRSFPHSSSPRTFSLDDFTVLRPFILRSLQEGQMSINANSRFDVSDIDIEIASELTDSRTQHVTCKAVSSDARTWQREWARISPLINARIDAIRLEQHTDMLGQRMIYNLFQTVVDYSSAYQGLDKVWLTANFGEAVGLVRFKSSPEESRNFVCCPYWLDPILHISGFALNGSEQKSTDHVYVAKSWSSLRIAAPLMADEEYLCYVHMIPDQAHTGTLMTGDVYAFDTKRYAVLVCYGITFQRLPRSALNQLLPARQSATRLSPINTNVQTSIRAFSSRSTSYESQSSRQLSSESAEGLETPMTPLTTPLSPVPAAIDVHKALATVTGMDVKDLTEETSLIELGVDSLMTLALNKSLQSLGFEELPIDLLLRSETIKDLNEWLVPPEAIDSQGSSTPQNAGALTETSKGAQTAFATVVLDTFAHELQLEPCSLSLDASLSDLGVDSILSSMIMESIFRQTGVQLPISLFLSETSLSDVIRAVSEPDPAELPLQIDTRTLDITITPLTRPLASSSNTLFLLPDGSGSAAPRSYAGLEASLGSVAFQVAFNVTLLSCSMTTVGTKQSLESLALNFARHIQQCQPHGPYFVGGWSVGGSIALECARHLLAAGQQVQHLILMDAPCFSSLSPMSSDSIAALAQLGVLENKNLPEDLRTELREQFIGTTSMLEAYKPTVIPSTLQVTAIWAKQGVLESVPAAKRAAAAASLHDPSLAWLLQPRHQSSLERRGWRDILPNCSVRHLEVPGDHFSMMRAPHVGELARALAAAVQS